MRTGHTFIQHFIQKEEPLRSPFTFGFQSNRVFTCTLNHIRKGINHPLQSDRNVFSDRNQSDRLRCLHEGFSVQLSRQSDYKWITWLHVNVANVCY